MTSNYNRVSQFYRYPALDQLCPQVTLKAAQTEARAMGYTIRREPGDGFTPAEARCFEVFPVGAANMALSASCPAEALFLAHCVARDTAANRLSFSGQPSSRAIGEELAARACDWALIDRDSLWVAVTTDPELNRPRVAFCQYGDSRPESVESMRERDLVSWAGRLASAAIYAAEEAEDSQRAAIAAARDLGFDIGQTGPDWEGCPGYYAQAPERNGNPGAFAFGVTPGAALRQLESDLAAGADGPADPEPGESRLAERKPMTTAEAQAKVAADRVRGMLHHIAQSAEPGGQWVAQVATSGAVFTWETLGHFPNAAAAWAAIDAKRAERGQLAGERVTGPDGETHESPSEAQPESDTVPHDPRLVRALRKQRSEAPQSPDSDGPAGAIPGSPYVAPCGPSDAVSGAFPLRAFRETRAMATRRVARAIAESMDLGLDWADPFGESGWELAL